MADLEAQFHETWLGMAQPSEGLVVSVPVLAEAQCMERQPREAQGVLQALVGASDPPAVHDLPALFSRLLDLAPERFHAGDDLPEALHLYVPEGRQRLSPTRALLSTEPRPAPPAAEDTEAAAAGRPYAMLVWELPEGLALDKPETVTGPWDYPPSAKFDRLLRACRVPIGLLSNGRELRLVYAPHGESSGWLAFRVADMCTVGGRPILDAFVMLLGRTRWFAVEAERQLPALLQKSRSHQATVTNDLSRQVFEALEILLAGFAAAAERDGSPLLREALERDDSHLYGGLLTVLLRLVFVLYCEERGLLPVDSELYAKNLSLLGLYDELQADHDAYPDSMHARFGAYPRLVALFRAVFLGADCGDLNMPPRRGALFDPSEYPFLEGWGPAGSAPMNDLEAASRVAVPSIDDATVHAVLERLLRLGGQRLSYQTLDVEQIGSVYEALMGFDVHRVEHDAVRIKLGSKKGAARVWVEAQALLQLPDARRAAYLKDDLGFDKGTATKITKALKGASTPADALAALEPLSGKHPERARTASLVVQPGPERRRTSSHYTPRELTEPIVERTLSPLIHAMGDAPKSESILNLVICDPAMGSGAFLVAACRYLADQLVAAWTREGKMELVADAHDDVVNHARRLIAQRCLYGVDKNPYAVHLARLSLWLVTMARTEPFTFVDHALRHGDSLVGLSFDQIRAFHWQPKKQLQTCDRVLDDALNEAVEIRKRILALAGDPSPEAQREKERLLFDAEDALDRVRLLGDLVIGAFFAATKDKAREQERTRRLTLVERWLAGDEGVEAELRAMQAELRETQTPFHWMAEFPEVFYLERPDPLDGDKVNHAAYVEAFVGNPPFAGKNGITEQGGPGYLEWLQTIHEGAHGNADLSAHFFRRADALLGAHGTIGLIATNTIGQGDTRATALQYLANDGYRIYAAERDMPWPGDAAVTVSIVHLAKGAPCRDARASLDRQPCTDINSRLRAKPERPDPVKLRANAELGFVGTYILGMGFTFDDAKPDATSLAEMRRLIEQNSHNKERIFPYLGGEEVNSSPSQSPHRYVISFGQMELADAEQWPDLLAIVREKVKPERDKNNRANYRDYWWRYGEYRPGLFGAIAELPCCLVTARHQPHLIFSFQPASSVFSEGLNVFAFHRNTPFAILQSRIQEHWARLLSSSMKTDLRYAASDCFETFPFPNPDPRTVIPELEAAGQALYEARAAHMLATNQGLTKLYNALKDPTNTDLPILHLRYLHEQMDTAVLAAYGWPEIKVPPYCALTDADRAAQTAFEDEVLDKLFQLNEERAKQEELAGPKVQKRKSKAMKGSKGSARGKAVTNDGAQTGFELGDE